MKEIKDKQQNKNQNLPKGWKKVKLGNYVSLIKGVSYSSSNLLKSKDSIFLINLKNINRGGGFKKEGLKNYNGEYKPEQLVKKDDIIIAMTDLTPQSEVIGMPALVPELEKKACISMDIVKLNLKKEEIDKKFLYYLLINRNYKGWIRGFANGVNVLHLNSNGITDYTAVIPRSLDEQKCIASILSAFDDKIELNNKINKTLEEMAQAIFKEWFIKNQKSNKEEIKNAENVFIFEKGIEPGSKYYSEVKKEGYIPFYRVRDLDKVSGVDVYIPKEIAKNKLCKEDDVLLSLDATIGRVKIGCNGTFSSGIRKVYSKDGFIKNSFIYFWLKMPYVQSTILEHASGTTILHGGQSIKYLQFFFSQEIIKQIQAKIDPMFEKILQLQKENQKLAELRDLLLPKLMSGEIQL